MRVFQATLSVGVVSGAVGVDNREDIVFGHLVLVAALGETRQSVDELDHTRPTLPGFRS
jgi:hypothetical protein